MILMPIILCPQNKLTKTLTQTNFTSGFSNIRIREVTFNISKFLKPDFSGMKFSKNFKVSKLYIFCTVLVHFIPSIFNFSLYFILSLGTFFHLFSFRPGCAKKTLQAQPFHSSPMGPLNPLGAVSCASCDLMVTTIFIAE